MNHRNLKSWEHLLEGKFVTCVLKITFPEVKFFILRHFVKEFFYDSTFFKIKNIFYQICSTDTYTDTIRTQTQRYT